MSEPSAAALHLLEALAGEGAYGFRPQPDEPGIIAVVGRRNGVSLRQASAPLAAARELETNGFAIWQGSARTRRRLELTASGWGKLIETIVMSDLAEIARPDTDFSPHAEAGMSP